MLRVRQVSRLLVKEGAHTGKRVCHRDMVKRSAPVISVGSARLSAAAGDIAKTVKKDQAWRYPGGIIDRHADRFINGMEYTDDKDTSQNRRRQESNFLITLNTNRVLSKATGAEAADALDACKNTLVELAKDVNICRYLKFGPKSDHYRQDRYADVITKIEWNSAVETGEQLQRLHCHIWLTVHHYSQVQINMPVMQQMFKEMYNDKLTPRHPMAIKARSKAYIQVKLLPTSDWAIVIKQYIHKAMNAVS